MKENKYNTKSTPLSLRIPHKLLHKIDEMAGVENIDRISWIKRAIIMSIETLEEAGTDGAIKDYISLRISEEDLINITGMKKIPKDLQEARKEVLNKIKQEAKGR